jgi:hypothetical protein
MREKNVQKNNPVDEQQDRDEPHLSLDTGERPAPIDVKAFTRRAGEIIAKAAVAMRKRARR